MTSLVAKLPLFKLWQICGMRTCKLPAFSNHDQSASQSKQEGAGLALKLYPALQGQKLLS